MFEQTACRPFGLEPRFVERIWGAESLGPWFPAQPETKRIGEVWLTSKECRIAGGSGTLAEAAAQFGAALGNADGDGFPLLIKLLYPREKLSVQVHPNDEQARAAGQARGKTECWYVLSAEPGAQVAVGFREPVTEDAIRDGIRDGSLEAKLRILPVKAGDLVFVDTGTVHAIGPGVVLLEVQQYSDVTYRLWDYGRSRELHVDAGLAVTRTVTQAGLVPPVRMDGFDRLIACPYFALDRFRVGPGAAVPLACAAEMQVLVALGAGCVLGDGELRLLPGQAVVVPAGDAEWALRADAEVEVIRVLGPGSER